ncbi:hypothetical protein [Lichenicoccus roseus]|uniref:Uncharacterized protein n=1 Tax=Lichenicoccus roseus TaxID=2683649 RepID=A0A5R9J5W5_9PROT|nr:hypothetical protein [Lichenicoccus roseus]TLU72952.1 hypothetical protein FE263_05735 [Lichenicoccus roseus]
MDIESFKASLAEDAPPPASSLALQALWWAGRQDWDRAHGVAQQDEGNPACDWVHAYLHRVEGDEGNARYWYRRARQPWPTQPPEQEWDAIGTELLTRTGQQA